MAAAGFIPAYLPSFFSHSFLRLSASSSSILLLLPLPSLLFLLLPPFQFNLLLSSSLFIFKFFLFSYFGLPLLLSHLFNCLSPNLIGSVRALKAGEDVAVHGKLVLLRWFWIRLSCSGIIILLLLLLPH